MVLWAKHFSHKGKDPSVNPDPIKSGLMSTSLKFQWACMDMVGRDRITQKSRGQLVQYTQH